MEGEEPMSLMQQYVRAGVERRMAADEITIREMLGRWVSGCEPSICYRQGSFEIIGLTAQDQFGGGIYVEPLAACHRRG
jgi:hypothetical protein